MTQNIISLHTVYMSGNKQQTDFILMNVNSADIVNAARTDDAVTAAVLKTKDIIVEVKRQFFLN